MQAARVQPPLQSLTQMVQWFEEYCHGLSWGWGGVHSDNDCMTHSATPLVHLESTTLQLTSTAKLFNGGFHLHCRRKKMFSFSKVSMIPQ